MNFVNSNKSSTKMFWTEEKQKSFWPKKQSSYCQKKQKLQVVAMFLWLNSLFLCSRHHQKLIWWTFLLQMNDDDVLGSSSHLLFQPSVIHLPNALFFLLFYSKLSARNQTWAIAVYEVFFFFILNAIYTDDLIIVMCIRRYYYGFMVHVY